MKITDDISSLKGIGEKKKEAFAGHGIATLEDLAWWFPRSYEDRRKLTPIGELRPGKPALIRGEILSRRYSGNPYKKHVPVSFLVSDDTGMLEVVYFNGRYMSRAFEIHGRYIFYGKITENRGRVQMVHPESCREGSSEDVRGVLPVYPAISGISQKEVRKFQRQIEPVVDEIPEWLPDHIVREYRLAGPAFALHHIHFPKDRSHILMSRFRLIFDELLTLSTGLLYMKHDNVREGEGVRLDVSAADEFIRGLPFPLTSGQKRVWSEIAANLWESHAMNRLVQGDVGSGKTAVAEISMFCAVRSGYQAAMMAPTEILARQHYQSLTKDFQPYGIRVGLLTGSMKKSEKKEVLERLICGDIDVLTGTHAVIQDDVAFRNLGLVITDEQHRFGVEQRRRLSVKGANPNVMVMTATPIPRTLAVILYGELDISVIDTMPAGRRPVRTVSVDGAGRSGVYRRVEKELAEGHQAYVVTPLIEDSEKIEAHSAERVYQELRQKYRNYRVALIHGELPQTEKDRIMSDFYQGKIDVLVSTVVIEIGINVANATVMVIENAERFGLAQLHQLRGRVGRGSDQSYCYLIQGNETDVARQRIRIMCESTDGFRIAEEDLHLRGPGEIFGTRQHGLPEMHISDIVRHGDVLEKARKAAAEILQEDPGLMSDSYAELRRRVEKMFGEDIKLEL